MNEETLKTIYKVCDMGVSSTNDLLNIIKTKENKINTLVEEEKEKYKEFLKETKKLFKQYKLEEDKNLMGKAMSMMSIKKETISDNSDAAIASMIIEGITMGTNELTNKLNDDVSKEIKTLATKILKFQEKEAEKLKEYL